MVFSYNWLQDYIKTKLPKPEKLAELLTMHFAEVEEIKKVGGDFILDIDVRPNRAGDCFSHIGIAREIVAILNYKFEIPRPKGARLAQSHWAANSKFQTRDFVSVEVKDRMACPRYTARVITDVKVGPSPKWLRDRLKICGLRPINNIVDIANYVMLETGQPLHAFDGSKLEGRKIIVRFAKNREKIVTLDEQKFDLEPSILVIADVKKPVAIAGIKGGKNPEVDKKTKIVVLEAANFNPRVVRKSSKSLNLKTDASLRFEHGIDPNLTELAILRAVHLIQEIAGGQAAKDLIDIYPKKVLSRKIKLDLDYVRSLLGIEISQQKIKDILERLGFKSKTNTKYFEVEVPTSRLDISIQEDLIEEIGRIYGYEKIPATFPVVSLIPPKRNEELFWQGVAKNILKELGFTEVYNYSFVSQGSKNSIEVENPTSSDYRYLREGLVSNLQKNIKLNQNNLPALPACQAGGRQGFKDIKIFELGKVFCKPNKEENMVAGMIFGASFYDIKGVVEGLLNKLGISDVKYTEGDKKSAVIKIRQESIGLISENYFEINFDKLKEIASEEIIHQPLSRYPFAIMDLAILVPRQTKVEEVLNKINAAGGKMVKDVDLFDLYEGEELPDGKKNLAFHIIYQAKDRTLKSEEVDKIHQKIIKTLEKKPRWQVRK